MTFGQLSFRSRPISSGGWALPVFDSVATLAATGILVQAARSIGKSMEALYKLLTALRTHPALFCARTVVHAVHVGIVASLRSYGGPTRFCAAVSPVGRQAAMAGGSLAHRAAAERSLP